MNLISSSNMNTPRKQFSATRLGGSGLVLVVGGLDADDNPLASAELFDPASGVFTTIAGALGTARYGHVGVASVGGAIFVIGGQTIAGVYLASVEIFKSGSGQPAVTGTFTTAAVGLASARGNISAELLASGLILITGGEAGAGAISLAEVYSPGI